MKTAKWRPSRRALYVHFYINFQNLGYSYVYNHLKLLRVWTNCLCQKTGVKTNKQKRREGNIFILQLGNDIFSRNF